MTVPTTPDTPVVTAELDRLADILDRLGDPAWETPSLCDGWRVREVVAHMTMPVRYSVPAFQAELEACNGDFGVLSDRVAARDASLPTATLIGNLRDEIMHRWTPPGGGPIGALVHAVIHGLDITVPLGMARPSPDDAVLLVLDHLTAGGAHAYFGLDVRGLHLRATDVDWTFGSGRPVTGAAADLALFLCGRRSAATES
jgi:uncharacterized protein (TIGR03083 family)